MAKILVIDDDPDVLTLMDRILAKKGHEVIHSASGVEGVTLAQAKQPDLILLDMLMPRIGGIQVLRHLRGQEKTKHIPIIVVTAAGQDVLDKINSIEGAKPDALLPKPFTPAELLESIGRVLDAS